MQKRQLIGYLVCLPTRTGLAYLAYKYGKTHRMIVSGVALLIAIGFMISQYNRTNNPGVGAFGSERYWNNYIHAFLYFIFACLCFFGYENAAAILLLDVLVGAYTITNHYASIEKGASKE